MVHTNLITVEVAYATLERQQILSIMVEDGSTIQEVIESSEMLELFPEINLQQQKVGIFSKLKKLTDTVKAGDRIEIYRPLLIDPKEARRAKARR